MGKTPSPAEDAVTRAAERVVAEFARHPIAHELVGMRALGAENDILGENGPVINYDHRQAVARESLEMELLNDLRFEHLGGRGAESLTWRLIVEADGEAKTDAASSVLKDVAEKPREEECWFWLEGFSTPERFWFSGIEFVPPREYSDPIPDETAATGSLLLVRDTGTDSNLIRARARRKADVALRRLRVVLDEERDIYADQLRFQIEHRFKFADGIDPLERLRNSRLHLGLGIQHVTSLNSKPIAGLPLEPQNDVEKQIEIATKWLERATLADEPELAMLYRFFSMEALFTKKDNNPKGLGKLITVRRATLGLIVEGKYIAPFYKPRLYNKVRSRAVHGEESEAFPEKLNSTHAWDSRTALTEYVKFALDRGFTERWKLVDALDRSPKRDNVIAALKHNDPKTWESYKP